MKHADTDPKRMLVDGSERRLFHICATRATHELQVSWAGDPTGYLESCTEVADRRSGFDVTEYLGCELDTATLADDPARFRIAGQDYVAGGRQIVRVLNSHLEGPRGGVDYLTDRASRLRKRSGAGPARLDGPRLGALRRQSGYAVRDTSCTSASSASAMRCSVLTVGLVEPRSMRLMSA